MATTASYQIEEETLLQSLLFNDFRKQIELDDAGKTELQKLFVTVNELFILLHITPGIPSQSKNAAGEEENSAAQLVLEAQLRREQQLTPLHLSKRCYHLIHFITTYLNKRIRIALSDKTLTGEQKQQLLLLSKGMNTVKPKENK